MFQHWSDLSFNFVLGYVVILVVFGVVGAAVYDIALHSSSMKFLKKGWRSVTLTIAIGVVLYNCAILVVTANIGADSANNLTAKEASAHFGLKADTPYPLKLGERFGGSTGEIHAYASSGLFFARASASAKLQPASALSIGYAYEDKSYVLELPMSAITFVQSDSVSPSVKLHFADKYVSGAYEQDIYGECHVAFVDMVFACQKPVIEHRYTYSDAFERHGLAPLVQKYLDSAVITLTPKMYDEVLGIS